jgi:peptidoglycan/LPS O-acetylase OafA/YrhL
VGVVTVAAHAAGYRPDVDGMRAIAVLAVVLFHAGVPGFSGGFLGVDVFFVISGYLITKLLHDEAARAGGIALGAFYARRVRRLLPALTVVLVATLILARAVPHTDAGLADVGAATLATTLYASNLWFWIGAERYFGDPAELNPLLHTWSLGVEEQFYLVWPVAVTLIAAWCLRRRADLLRTLRIAVAALLAISLLACAWWLTRDPQAVFYHPLARTWQLALGATLALHAATVARSSPGLAAGIGWVGAGLIAGAVAIATPATSFQGSLAAALGAALVIFACQRTPQAVLARGLGLKPLVWIGLLSYSWYLWHWPVLSAARARNWGELDPWQGVAASALALLLAWVTFVAIERPVRQKRPWRFATTRGTLLTGLALSATVAVLGGWTMQKHGARAARDVVEVAPGCLATRDATRAPPLAACTLGRASAPSLLLVGDSHAWHYAPLLERYAEERGTAVGMRMRNDCPVLLGYAALSDPEQGELCLGFASATWAELGRIAGLRGVVLSDRWTNYMGQPPADPNELEHHERERGMRSAERLRPALASSVAAARALGLRVLLIAPTPEFGAAVPLCAAQRGAEGCGLARAGFDARRQAALAELRALAAADPGIRVFDPAVALCDASACPAARDGRLLYIDDDHLAASASRSLLEAARPWLDWVDGADAPPEAAP